MTIRCDQVVFSYDGVTRVLGPLSFGLEAGSTLLIVGHNGAGKSTLFKLLNGILRPGQGRIIVNGRLTAEHPTSALAREICVTFQHPGDQIFNSTVQREVEFAPSNLQRRSPAALAHRALSLLNLQSKATQHPYDLHAADRKLVTIASAIASDAPILAFDEPTVQLSQPERRLLHGAFGALRREGRTLLLISHDLPFCLPISTHLLILSAGETVYFGPSSGIWACQSLLRRAGVRMPMAIRLRPYAGLGETLPEPSNSTSSSERAAP